MSDTWILGDSTKVCNDVVVALNKFLRGFDLIHTRLSTPDSLMSTHFTYLGAEPVKLVSGNSARAAHIDVPLRYGNFSIPVRALEVDGARHQSVVQINSQVLLLALPFFFYEGNRSVDWHHHSLVRTKKR